MEILSQNSKFCFKEQNSKGLQHAVGILTFRITNIHAYTELCMRQMPIAAVTLWLSVLTMQSDVASFMESTFVCQFETDDTVVIKSNHHFGYNMQPWLAGQFVFWMQRQSSVSLIVLIAEENEKEAYLFQQNILLLAIITFN